MENVGLFHHFRGLKNFLRNSWKKWKKLAWPTFSTTQAVLEAQIVENVGQANFFDHFHGLKNFVRNSWKMSTFSRLQSWKMLVMPTFCTQKLVGSWQGLGFQESLMEKVSRSYFFHEFGGWEE